MTFKRNAPPPDDIRQYYAYDAETGAFSRNGGTRMGGRPVGFRCPRGYLRLGFRRRQYLAHVLAWWFVHNQWPDLQVDHRNNDNTDNRIANLRLATASQNMANRPSRRNGPKGAFRHTNGGWTSRIGHHGRVIHLGTFQTEEEAAAAYAEAARRYHGDFART